MFRNYLATALRNMSRTPLYAAINILGLSIGIAAALLIALFVREEMSFDTWIAGHENVYRLRTVQHPPSARAGVPDITTDWVRDNLFAPVQLNTPEVQVMTRLLPEERGLRGGAVESLDTVFWADGNIFEVFPFPVVAGDLLAALKAPNSVVLTRRMARKYFGRDDVVGEILEVDRAQPLRITAIIEDLPARTHLNIDIVASQGAGWSPVFTLAYPAFVLASLRPATVLRGLMGRQASSRIRQSLVVLQFAVLIGLLIPVAVVYRQTQFALTEAKRLDTDQVVVVLGPGPCVPAFKEGLSAIPGVRGVACTSATFATFSNGSPTKGTNGGYIAADQVSVSHEFFAFYGLKPIAGRFFSETRAGDLMPADADAPVQGTVVLNETAVRALGFASPEDAIGKSTSLNEKTGAPAEIIGVVPDFAFDTVHQAIRPVVYYTGRGRLITLSIRIDGASAPEILTAIDQLWKQTGPPHPIIRQFLDQRIAGMYEDITQRGTLFTIFAGAAVAIAALGLLGLALFNAEQRTKEIGIRKSMGATRFDILRLLLWQFARPVLIANLIAWPVAYYFMRRWLDGFAYRIDLAPWMFLGASAIALVIALLTVIGHALLVSRARPVSALRYE